jgi:thiol:disulfide interchange protein DsbA
MINKIFNINALLLLLSLSATAQPEVNKDYELIPSDLIEGQAITEVFGYWCNACFSFESTVMQLKEQRPDVNVVQIPAGNETYARLFYTIKALNLGKDAHLNVYKDIQLLRKNFNNEADIEEFAARHDYDQTKFMNVYSSFGTGIKAKNALRTVRELGNAGVLEGVPTILINGKYKFRRTADAQKNISNMLFLYDN